MKSILLNIRNKTIDCIGCMLKEVNIVMSIEKEKGIENQKLEMKLE